MLKSRGGLVEVQQLLWGRQTRCLSALLHGRAVATVRPAQRRLWRACGGVDGAARASSDYSLNCTAADLLIITGGVRPSTGGAGSPRWASTLSAHASPPAASGGSPSSPDLAAVESWIAEQKVAPVFGLPQWLNDAPQLMARGPEMEKVKDVVDMHYVNRAVSSPRQRAFVLVCGHVLSGKTRFGAETVEAMLQWRISHPEREKILDPAYLRIDFRGGAAFRPAFDNGLDPSVALGVRLASAAFGTDLDSMRGAPLESMHDELVVARFLDRVLEGQPEDAVLPIVVHLDHYDTFADAAGRDQLQAMVNSLERLVCCSSSRGLVGYDAYRGRFILLPVFSGLSRSLVSIPGQQYIPCHIPLARLSFSDSITLAKQFLKLKGMQEDRILKLVDESEDFRIAVGDASGLPGFVEALCDAAVSQMQRGESSPSLNFSAVLENAVATYMADQKRPGRHVWKNLVQLSLNSVRIARNKALSYSGAEEKVLLADVLDRGIARRERDNRITLCLPLLRMWNDDLVYPTRFLNTGSDSTTRPWTWQDFVRAHVNHVGSTLSAMHSWRTELRKMRRFNLMHVFRGAKTTSTSLYLHQSLKVIPRVPSFAQDTEQRLKISLSSDSEVRMCVPGTPVFDAYFSAKGNSRPITVFMQYLRPTRDDDATASVGVRSMVDVYDHLTYRLLSMGWDENHVCVLVCVTNRQVFDPDTTIGDRPILWISMDEMEAHVPLFAHRALIPLEA